MATTLNLICAGAGQGLVKALQPGFEQATGTRIQARFGAVGAMQEALRAGEPCDVLVLTQALIEGLVAEGLMAAGSVAPLGRVRTGVAVRAGTPWPDLATPDALEAALRAASGLYVPDTVRSTAGQHVARVLRELGLAEEMAPRLREFPNGATAMREMAASTEATPLGCTQVTEIRYTPGVELVAVLPPAFELATLYTAAVAARSPQAALARQFVAVITGPDAAALRTAGGFEP